METNADRALRQAQVAAEWGNPLLYDVFMTLAEGGSSLVEPDKPAYQTVTPLRRPNGNKDLDA